MYERDAAKIAEYAQACPENLRRVINFVVLTMRVPFYRIPGDMKSLDRGRMGPLWGFKRHTYEWVAERADEIYAAAMANSEIDEPGERERALIAQFAGIPGIGLVKGGFIAQLAFGCGGCLDVNNIERFDLPHGPLRSNTFKSLKCPERKAARVELYQTMLQQCGGTEALWNEWCEYLAQRNPERYESADRVSALHVECCIG